LEALVAILYEGSYGRQGEWYYQPLNKPLEAYVNSAGGGEGRRSGMDGAGISAVLMGAAAVIGATAQLVNALRRRRGGGPPEDAEEK
jgi:hypothetical protein